MLWTELKPCTYILKSNDVSIEVESSNLIAARVKI